jgi:hypothetical protein
LWLSKSSKWRIYAKAPFAGPEQVLRYLGRYTHRIAISNARILALDNDRVSFAYRDRRNGNARATLSLEAPEFVRRFLRHVVPKRFVRVRHYGVLANPLKAELVPLCRRLLATRPLIAKTIESGSRSSADLPASTPSVAHAAARVAMCSCRICRRAQRPC